MKIYILAFPLLAMAACNAAPPQNNIQDVAANNMIADDVTEVQDDSASAPTAEKEADTGGAVSNNATDQSR